MTANEHISQEDLLLYAMQMLSDAESAMVQRHLELCALCRNEFAAHSADLALVGLSVEQKPVPDGARQRFLNKIAVDAAASERIEKSQTPRVRQPLFSFAWVSWAAAAVMLVVAILLGMQNNKLANQLHDASMQMTTMENQSAQARQVLDLLTSRSAQRVMLTSSKTPPEPTGRAIYLAESGSLVFQANNLKLLEADKTYELWVIPVNGKPIPAGLFKPDASGFASVIMPTLPKGVAAKAFGVTVEKAEGSDTPTAPIVLAGATAAAGE
jgi:hypothetical protein